MSRSSRDGESTSVQAGWNNYDKQRILDAVDLADLIGEQLQLKRSGREFKALCPFHDDSNPSFYVNPQKGIYKCFACGAGGNALTWLENYFQMTRGEAWKLLSERTGIKLPAFREGARKPRRGQHLSTNPDDGEIQFSDADPAAIVEAHRTALSFYRAILRHAEHGRIARRVFEERGISQDMIGRFELGATPGPDMWDGLVQTLQKKQVPLQPFIESGLVSRRKSGDGFIDRFRNRILFPIHDLLGRPVAFGARRIDPDDEPKYLNSPEHARFNKSATLYGLHLAQRTIQNESTAIVVEGYTDVIACHARGITNAVATLGTALTRDHARILQRLCDRVVLLFDGDDAGRRAADRAVEIFFQTNIDIHIALLPDGQDPADLLAAETGVERFREVVESGREALEYLLRAFQQELRTTTESGGISSRQRLIQAFLARLSGLGFHRIEPVRRALILERLASMLDMPRETVLRTIPKPRAGFNASHSSGSSAVPAAPDAMLDEFELPQSPLSAARRTAEEGLLGCMLCFPETLIDDNSDISESLASQIRGVRWRFAVHAELANRLAEFVDAHGHAVADQKLPDWGEEEIERLANDLAWEIGRQTLHSTRRDVESLIDAYLRAVQQLDEPGPEMNEFCIGTSSDDGADNPDSASAIHALRARIARMQAMQAGRERFALTGRVRSSTASGGGPKFAREDRKITVGEGETRLVVDAPDGRNEERMTAGSTDPSVE